MPDGSQISISQGWLGVGVHPTPFSLVQKLAAVVSESVGRRCDSAAPIQILDACAGDGRLGHAVAARLSALGFVTQLTLVEVDFPLQKIESTGYEVVELEQDFFGSGLECQFDVVVSNPPYLALGREDADRLGLEWGRVVSCGRNLYGLALSECLRLCRPAGVVGMVAPHGWLRNQRGQALREKVLAESERVDIYAFGSRRLFPGVHQDTAIQVFEKRPELDVRASMLVRISYDDGDLSAIPVSDSDKSEDSDGFVVRIGPFVWNRQKQFLSKCERGIPVVYGGNISSCGKLELGTQRYQGRQYAAKSRLPQGYISLGPCIAVKRSLRGVPGNWRADIAVVPGGLEFVAENHVIVVEMPAQCSRKDLYALRKRLVDRIERDHQHHGHPNISVALVRSAVSEVFSGP